MEGVASQSNNRDIVRSISLTLTESNSSTRRLAFGRKYKEFPILRAGGVGVAEHELSLKSSPI